MDVDVRQKGNRFDLKVAGADIFFEVANHDCPPDVSADFAVWAALPFAMRRGEKLHVRGRVDPVSLANAHELSRIWSMWVPEAYTPIEVTADEVAVTPAAPSEDGVLLFSGGVDSTFALLENLEAARLTSVLTVHGLDYSHDDTDAINALLGKTQPLLDRHGLNRIVVRTNIGPTMRQPGLTHGFMLATCLFLFNGGFRQGHIAADITPPQDFLTFPWGTNHITNDLFAASHYGMRTLGQKTSRIRKLDALREDAVAMSAISFCAARKMRPHNCGVCSKCVRTKLMMIALTGSCPDIFLDTKITDKQIRQIDAHSNKSFRFEILQTARERGHLDKLGALEQHMQRGIRATRRRAATARVMKRIRHIGSKLLPF
ncbi:hypothetical protein [Ancylobacter terrae]|uniref:hypothetical protein n=1 Tax=Ancylobacter sp. sgz301288 TaxID=3342077 RepID=UPI00385D0EC9